MTDMQPTSQASSPSAFQKPLRQFMILRIIENPEYGNQGVLIDLDKKEVINTTLERIWKNNEAFVSCIPEGDDYIATRFHSEKHPNTFQITGPKVANRPGCLFHPGTTLIDSEGCVLVGEKFDPVWIEKENRWSYGVLESQIGFKQFMDSLNGVDQFRLIIKKAA